MSRPAPRPAFGLGRAGEGAASAGAGLLAGLAPPLGAAVAAGCAAAIALVSVPGLAAAHLLSAASFLSGLHLDVGSLSVRPEQAAGLAGLAALLVRRRVAPLPRSAILVVLWLVLGAVSGLGEPGGDRALLHAARLFATALPVVLLPGFLPTAEAAERAWDIFLHLAVAAAAIGLGCWVLHLAFGWTAGIEVQSGFTLRYAAARGPLLEPNVLGALCAAAAAAYGLRLLAGDRPARATLSWAASTILVAAAVASLTRVAWMALPVALGAALLVRARLERRSLARPLLALAALTALAGAAGLAAYPRLEERLSATSGLLGKVSSLLRLTEDPNVAMRLRSYRSALELWREAPLFGRGHGAMERLAGGEDSTLAWAGNLEVHLLVDTGLAGLVLILGFVALALLRVARAAVRSAGEARRRHLERLAALAVLLICAQATETTWLASFWVLFGLALAAVRSPQETGDGRARILYVHPSDELYGSDRVLLELLSRLDRSRFAPQVVLSSDVAYAGRLSRRLEALSIPVHRRRLGVLRRQALSSPGRAARFAADVVLSTAALARFLVAERIALVHANTVTVFPAALAARLTATPLVWHVHEIVTDRPGRAVLHAMVRLLATRVAVVSEAARHALGAERWRRPAEVIPNGVEARRPRGAPGQPPVLAYVGRLSRRKGPHVFVQAAAFLAERHPRARFVLAGDEFGGGDELAREIAAEGARLGLGDRLELRPFRDDVGELLREATAVVSPSILPESFGLAILEAMAEGRPVVASDHGGPRELVVDGVTGYLVPPGDARRLADALERLLDDPALAARLGEAARERALSRYDIQTSVERFEALYAECLSHRGLR